MEVTNIKILIDNNYEAQYNAPEDLGIKLNRIVDDLTDLTKRYGEFSYTFTLPKNKINNQIFNFPDVKGRRGIFIGNSRNCKLYNNNRLILDGIIELRGINNDGYDCAFFSQFTQLLDAIGDKSLKDIKSKTIGVLNNFKYETDIINHINANYTSSDNTIYQFPFVFYSTVFSPYNVIHNAGVDFQGLPFAIPDRDIQNWYYIFGHDKNGIENKFYFHQFPMAIYIVPILNAIFEDTGWSLGGSFFERDEIKKIIMLYTGDNDIYDKAIGCPDDKLSECTGGTGQTSNLVIKTFLPDMKQSDFISGLINLFNLYPIIDINNKNIKFETWYNLFQDTYNPYDITNKVIGDTVKFSRIDNYDPSILFEDNENMKVLGDNKVFTNNKNITYSGLTTADTDDTYAQKIFNKVGTTSEIKVPFGLPNIGRKYLRQDYDINGYQKNGGDFQIFLPILTSQTINDDNSKGFYSETGDTFVMNTEDKIEYQGKPTLMYYYGQSNTNYQKINGTDNSYFYYLGIGSGTTRTKIGFASPFVLLQGTEKDNINNYLADNPIPKNISTTEISYLKGNIYNLGLSGEDIITGLPPYSLTFGQDDTWNRTLYTVFHKPKYDLYVNSELLVCDMKFNDNDWNEMQINRCIRYNDQYYSIISIENYDIVLKTASLKLIKK